MASLPNRSTINYGGSSPLGLSMESTLSSEVGDEDKSPTSSITNDKSRQALDTLLLMVPKVATGEITHQKMIDGIFSIVSIYPSVG